MSVLLAGGLVIFSVVVILGYVLGRHHQEAGIRFQSGTFLPFDLLVGIFGAAICPIIRLVAPDWSWIPFSFAVGGLSAYMHVLSVNYGMAVRSRSLPKYITPEQLADLAPDRKDGDNDVVLDFEMVLSPGERKDISTKAPLEFFSSRIVILDGVGISVHELSVAGVNCVVSALPADDVSLLAAFHAKLDDEIRFVVENSSKEERTFWARIEGIRLA